MLNKREQYTELTWASAVIGAGFAFIWLGTDYWFFGLCSITGLVASFWFSVKADRHV